MNKSCSKNIFLRFSFFVLLHLLVAAYRGVYKTWRVIYNEAFFAKILNGFKLLTIFAKKLYHKCSIGLNIGFWLTVSNIRLTFVPSLQIKPRSYSGGKYVWHRFWKGKRAWWAVNRASIYVDAATCRVF